MNSKSLQKKFSEVYSEFFGKNDLVMSWCFSFSWSPLPWKTHASNYIRIKSKIPLKCYIWVKLRKDKKIIFKDVLNYDLSKKTFTSTEFDVINPEAEKLKKIIIENLSEDIKNKWLDIEILSEISRWHWFWFSGTTAWIISTIIKTLNWDTWIKDSKLDIWSYSDEIYKLGLKMDFISRYWNSNWENVINVIEETNWPSYLITEDFSENDYGKIDDLSYKFKSFGTTRWDSVWENVPLDYYMIYSWTETDTKSAELFKKSDSQEFDNLEKHLKEEILNCLDNDKYYLSKFTNDWEIYRNFTDSISALNIKTITLLANIFKAWFDEFYLDKFVENVNEYRYAISLIEKQTSFAENFINSFLNNKSNPDEKIWIMPSYYSKLGWWYIVVTKYWISRETIEKTIENLKNIYPKVAIEYSSHLDWFASSWVELEQYITKWIYSKYVEKDKVILKNNRWETKMIDYKEIFNNKMDWLLLDNIAWKIYFDWVKLTSQDIHSQNTTVEVLTLLIDNINEEMENKNLSSSSYSKNKNEMIWKIIVPIIKLVEDRTWERIALSCKWSMNEFYLKLQETKLPMWVIKKI